ncbi:disease resistance protein RPP4-like isoform X2 [Carica papaya]|uniref:disease resistance protein RPP4-like isoform X2 n=2 Tax=Carica papaya TaxID=3649 RepID=UPI000B8CE1CA|nr:disease resistance protein RPP4-like isoform X2 [Carica papaya]XP_021909741.1 disease resistance protein RPP4-like isoform X2 [Carica papaya]
MASQRSNDVFISFRGEDTGDNFTSHLYAGLCRKKIQTFICNKIKRGDEISRAILKTIEASKLAVIVFSEEYASSKCCLEELLKILECRKEKGQIVVPVFYHVDPSHVRNQSGNFGEAFSEAVKHFSEQEQSWRSALKEATNLSGWDSSMVRPESILVDEIVSDILKKLDLASSSVLKESLVGIYPRVSKVISLLCIGSPDFRMVGIWGMGGIGKTTIAEAVFNRISSHFESCYFLNKLREAEKRGDLPRLRDELLSNVLNEENLRVCTPTIGSAFIKSRLQSKRVLIVLDDVDDLAQLEFLFGGLDKLGPGSRVILTTRDKQILNSYDIVDIYDVEKLNDHHAFELFCQHAFKKDNPSKSYIELSMKVIDYAHGIPLALKVLGSNLCHKSEEHWESALRKLKRVPNLKIQEVLKISYDALDKDLSNIFLDIACFFKGQLRDDVERILGGCYGHSVLSGIDVLIDKSLISVSNKRIEMHDLLQEMGWSVVRQESEIEPGKRSRLWTPEDIYHVLTKNTGTETIRGIFLDESKVKEMKLSPMIFSKMYNLKFLKIYHESYQKNSKVCLPRGLKLLPDELRYLYWDAFPLKSLPCKFRPEYLVELYLPYSKIKQLWSGTQELVNLEKMYLAGCKNLIELPDLSLATNIKDMTLRHCKSIVEIPSSIGHLNKLTHLDLSGCIKLKSLPTNINLRSLEFLNLFGCTKMATFPEISRNIKYLYLNGTGIEEVPSSIKHISSLLELNLSNCTRLVNISSSIQGLNCLQVLNLNGCTNVTMLPEISEKVDNSYLNMTSEEDPASIGCLSALRELWLHKCPRLKSLPPYILMLKSLESLYATETSIEQLPSILKDSSNLTYLCISGCEGREPVPLHLTSLIDFQFLTSLELSNLHITEIPEDIDCLLSLESLDLSSNDFKSIPGSIKQLSMLRYLTISNCNRLQLLPELPPSVASLHAHDCSSLERILGEQKFPRIGGEGSYIFSNCFKLNQNEYKTIVANVQFRIQHLMESDEEDEFGTSQVAICLPGSEISDWFNHKSNTSSITIQLSPHWFNSKFFGFALCIVAEFDGYFDGFNLSIICDYHLENKDGECYDLCCRFKPWPKFRDRPKFVESEHMFFLYDTSMYMRTAEESFSEESSDENYEEVSFKFSIVESGVKSLSSYKVKSCGVRLLYDAREFWESPMDDDNEVDSISDDAYYDYYDSEEEELDTEFEDELDTEEDEEADIEDEDELYYDEEEILHTEKADDEINAVEQEQEQVDSDEEEKYPAPKRLKRSNSWS